MTHWSIGISQSLHLTHTTIWRTGHGIFSFSGSWESWEALISADCVQRRGVTVITHSQALNQTHSSTFYSHKHILITLTIADCVHEERLLTHKHTYTQTASTLLSQTLFLSHPTFSTEKRNKSITKQFHSKRPFSKFNITLTCMINASIS